MYAIELENEMFIAEGGNTCHISKYEDIEWFESGEAARVIAQILKGKVRAMQDMLEELIKEKYNISE